MTRHISLSLVLTSLISFSTTSWADTVVIDPDDAANEQDISSFFSGVTLSALGPADDRVFALGSGFTPPRFFAWKNDSFLDAHWGRDDTTPPTFRAEFDDAYFAVCIDVHVQGDVTLEAFDAEGASLGTAVEEASFPTAFEGTLSFIAGSVSIRAIEVSIEPVIGADFGLLDHLVLKVPEPASATLLGWGLLLALSRGLQRRRRGTG